MTTATQDMHREGDSLTPTTTRRHRRTVAVTAITVGALVATAATEIADGSSWS